MWDNRGNKKNPKGPDYKCKNRECGHAIWLPRAKQTVAGSPRTMQNGQPKWTWSQLAKTYERSLLVAELRVKDAAERAKLPLTMADVLAAAATVFIAATRDGVAEPKVKLPPPPESDEEDYDEPGPY